MTSLAINKVSINLEIFITQAKDTQTQTLSDWKFYADILIISSLGLGNSYVCESSLPHHLTGADVGRCMAVLA